MVKKIELTFELGGRAVVELDEVNTPKHVKALWERLPIQGTIRYAPHDYEIYIRHSLGGIWKPEGPVARRKPEYYDRVLCFTPERQGLAFMFGKCKLSTFTDYTPIGNIVEGIDDCVTAWKRVGNRARTEKAYEIGTIKKLKE